MAQQQTLSRYKKLSTALVATVIVVGGGVLSSGTTSAKKASKAVPQAPTIVSIQTKVAKNGQKADLKFTIALPTNVTKKSIASSEVSIGNKKCVMKKAKTSCTIRGVDAYSVFSVTAKTKANNKFSKASKKIRFSAGQSSRKWFNPAYRPTPVTNRNLVSVLGAAGGKVTNMQGVRRGARASSVSTLHVRATSDEVPRFTLNTTDVVAYAQLDNSTAGTGLNAISSSGVVSEALTVNWTDPQQPNGPSYNGPPIRVSKFFIAPNSSGRIYVQFSMPFKMTVNAEPCMFYSFSMDNGEPFCVDSKITGMHWFGGWMMQRYTNPGVQFDAAGNVYYMGHSFNMGQGSAVLRKYDIATGVRTDFADFNSMIDDFAVLADGSVIMVGGTTSTSAQWTRIVAPNNSRRNLSPTFTTSAARFITQFADGNYYLGAYNPGSPNGNGVVRFIASTGQLDPKYWIQSSTYGDKGLVNSSQMAAEFNGVCTRADGQQNYSDPFCSSGGSFVAKVARVDGKDFVLNAQMGSSAAKSLMQYYPTLKRVPTSITNVTLMESTGSKLILAGTNDAGTQIMSVYDPATDQETIVMDGANETEIYSMTYVQVLGKVMFSGQQFSNGAYVVGEIAIP